jgi:septum formation inhibitor MinC
MLRAAAAKGTALPTLEGVRSLVKSSAHADVLKRKIADNRQKYKEQPYVLVVQEPDGWRVDVTTMETARAERVAQVAAARQKEAEAAIEKQKELEAVKAKEAREAEEAKLAARADGNGSSGNSNPSPTPPPVPATSSSPVSPAPAQSPPAASTPAP